MILSSINFIRANTKPKLETDRQFTDFIIDKIKEEQDRRDASIDVTNCPCPQKLEQKVKGTTSCNRGIPKETDTTVELRVPPHNADVSEDSIVSIETGDGYFFSVHNMYNRLQLSDTESPNKNCIFRQKQIKVPEKEGEKKKLMVAFHLNHDKTKYISVGTDKRIEISAKEAELDPSNPDDRFFVIHEIDNGMVFVQPYHHKGYYFHHMDSELTVSKFELNYRPPEEFFFKINKINILETEMSAASSMSSSVTTEDVTHNRNTNQHHHHHHNEVSSSTVIPPFQKSQNVKSQRKMTHKPSLFRGCFGLVSKQENKSKKQ